MFDSIASFWNKKASVSATSLFGLQWSSISVLEAVILISPVFFKHRASTLSFCPSSWGTGADSDTIRQSVMVADACRSSWWLFSCKMSLQRYQSRARRCTLLRYRSAHAHQGFRRSRSASTHNSRSRMDRCRSGFAGCASIRRMTAAANERCTAAIGI